MQVLRTLLASCVVLVAGGVALAVATDHFQAFTTETARRIAVRERPVRIPAVQLESASGAPVNLDDFRGKWLLIDFIYTRCPTLCVALGDEFAQLQDSLAGPLAQGRLQLLSISFDPEHDTPQALTGYLQRSGTRGPGWIAARPVNAAGLARIERVFSITVIPGPLGGYVHNAAIHVVNPRGRLVEIDDLGDPDQITHIMRRDLAR